jgi:NADH-quinone oxidoreductase subunit N
MTITDIQCLIPFMIIAAAPIIMMITITISRNYKVIYGFSLIMFLAAFLSLFIVRHQSPHSIEPLIIFDNYSIMLLGTVYGISLLLTILSYVYLNQQGGEREEYFIILFVATLGASVLITANHFITFFLGLETLSISLYVLIAYLKDRNTCIEAGVKFLVIASVATAFLLFGMGLIYASTGKMSFNDVAASIVSTGLSPLLLAGFGMMLVGIGFKLALAPFHMWTPDVYQGAPAPVAGFIATISKGAVLAISIRLFFTTRLYVYPAIIAIISVIAVLSMFTGNLLALRQSNFKRMLAYSSIAHLGYLLIILLTGTEYGIEAAIFYLISYMITTVGAFGVISILSVCNRDAEEIEDLRGLFRNSPWIAIVLSLTILSLAGIPLTAGFISKFYLVLAGLKSGLWVLAVSLIINSVISLYYYLGVIKTMFTPSDEKKSISISLAGNLVLAIVLSGILFLGILPSFLTGLIAGFSSLN